MIVLPPYLIRTSAKRRVKDAYRRITLNWVTTSFFVFSFLHCFAQGLIQSFMFSLDSEYESLTKGITDTANISNKAVPYRTGPYNGDFKLEICNDIPFFFPDSCSLVFDSQQGRTGQDSTGISNSQARILDPSRIVRFQKAEPSTPDDLGVVDVLVISEGGDELLLKPQCSKSMLYIRELFNRTKREDVTWICLQFWLFFISFMAIVNDSIPHTLTVLATRTLATAWSAYAVWRNQYRRNLTDEMITTPGSACSVDLLPAYFETRGKLEIPDLLLNCTALAISAYLSLTLLKVYSRQSFKVMGAPQPITRIQKFFLAVLSILQLEVFVVLIAMALWIDELSNGPIARVANHATLYRGMVIATSITLWPWITLGWYSIRREHRVGIYVYMAYNFGLIACWLIIFYSQVYRWTFVQWPYFGCYVTASLVLLVASFVFALVCRLNFGKGLKEYIQAESALSSSGIKPEVFTHDVEKNSIIVTDDDIVDGKDPNNPFNDPPSSLPPHSLQVPTPTYYVPELRSSSPSMSPEASSRVLQARKMSVFEPPPVNLVGRPASPPLSMDPNYAKNGPQVVVTKLSPVRRG